MGCIPKSYAVLYLKHASSLDYEKLYREAIKADITLESREAIKEIVARVKREENKVEWTKITKLSNKLRQATNTLRKNGYLKIKTGNEINLIDSLMKASKNIEYSTSINKKHQFIESIEQIPEVIELTSDKKLYALASLYLGAPAKIYSCEAWWQFPVTKDQKPSNTQLWHRDRDDFGVLKLFMYGNDVDKRNGPHSFIPKTHTMEGTKEAFDLENNDVDRIIGKKHQFMNDKELKEAGLRIKPVIWTGPAGLCFLEDTRGFHRAYIPENRARLIFSIVWTIGDGWRS